MSETKEGYVGCTTWEFDGCSWILEQQGIAQKTSRWEQESWAYHGDDGKSFFGENQGRGRDYGPTFAMNDIVGYGVNFSASCAFFSSPW
ncbi:hypothetical protein V8E54_014529 [Elaphomyces granulatus]